MKPQDVLEAVAETFGLPVSALRGTSKTQHVSGARQAAMLILRDYLPWLSAEEIGRLLRRDHTTVLYGVTIARTRGREEQWYQQLVLEALALAREPRERAA